MATAQTHIHAARRIIEISPLGVVTTNPVANPTARRVSLGWPLLITHRHVD